MKVLGLSFGRKMRNCEILVKEALMGAEKMGAEVEFLRCIDLDISHCTGCGGCGALKSKGKDPQCIIKDDYKILEEAILNADAVIVSAPVYVLAPVGQVKNFIDRFGPMHDMAAMVAEKNRREEEGLTPLDARIFKQRYVGYISVGGAITPNWVSLGLPNLQLFGFSTLMKVVDQLDAFDMGRKASPFLEDALMARVNQLGQNVADAMGKAPEDVAFKGDEGTCPVCHCNIITINKSTNVECPICGISGKLSVVGDEVKVEFSQAEQNRARGTLVGLNEHYHEIQGMIKVAIPKLQGNKEMLASKNKEYEEYLKVY